MSYPADAGPGRRGRPVNPRLALAKTRLDRLDWWPEPVRIDGIRLWTAPWFFRLPGLRRFDGYAFTPVHPRALPRRVGRSRHPRALPRLAAAASPVPDAVELPRHRVRSQSVRTPGAGGRHGDPFTTRRSRAGSLTGQRRRSRPRREVSSRPAAPSAARVSASDRSSGTTIVNERSPRAPTGGAGAPATGPRVQPDMVVVAAGGDEQRPGVAAHAHVESERVRRRTPPPRRDRRPGGGRGRSASRQPSRRPCHGVRGAGEDALDIERAASPSAARRRRGSTRLGADHGRSRSRFLPGRRGRAASETR